MYLMLPAAIACSMAFHMPVGTPPNAIVAGIANIGTGTMVNYHFFRFLIVLYDY